MELIVTSYEKVHSYNPPAKLFNRINLRPLPFQSGYPNTYNSGWEPKPCTQLSADTNGQTHHTHQARNCHRIRHCPSRKGTRELDYVKDRTAIVVIGSALAVADEVSSCPDRRKEGHRPVFRHK